MFQRCTLIVCNVYHNAINSSSAFCQCVVIASAPCMCIGKRSSHNEMRGTYIRTTRGRSNGTRMHWHHVILQWNATCKKPAKTTQCGRWESPIVSGISAQPSIAIPPMPVRRERPRQSQFVGPEINHAHFVTAFRIFMSCGHTQQIHFCFYRVHPARQASRVNVSYRCDPRIASYCSVVS